MKVTIIVQARITSHRLPGKALKPMVGRPMLQWVMESVAASQKADDILLATSDDLSDDVLEDFAKEYDWPYVRGPLENVARRFLIAAEHSKSDAVVRICGDSPVVPYTIIDNAIELFHEGGADLVTNVQIRSFPKGASVEVFSKEVLRKMVPDLDSASDKEHVTPWLYRQKSVRVRNFLHDPSMGNERLMVDTEDDFRVMSRVLEQLNRPHTEYTLDEIVALRRKAATELELSHE
jgi:spore coat polysaccharide biosynthesis protein SpsF